MAKTPACLPRIPALRTSSDGSVLRQHEPASSVLGVDAAGVVRFATPSIAQLTGHAPADFLGRELSDFVIPFRYKPIRAKALLRWLGLVARGPRSVSTIVRSSDGRAIPVVLSAWELWTHGLLMVSLDLRTSLPAVLGEASELSAIVGGVLEVIITVDSDHRIRRFNRSAENLLGWSAEEILGQPLDWLIPKRARQAHTAHIARFAASGVSARLMRERDYVVALHRDGYEIPVEASILRYEQDGRQFYTAVMRDVRQRLAREAELHRSKARLANAQRIARLGNWEWDIGTGTLLWSDEVYRIFGCEPQSFSATYSEFLQRVHPGDRASVERAVNRTLEQGKVYEIDHRIVRPDGAHRIVHEQAEIEHDDTGSPVRMVGTVQDVTEQRQREAALEIARQAAESADRAKSEFLAAMSHELRTPLNAIIGFADMIDKELFGDVGNNRYRQYARDILESGELLLRIVNDILDISRIEAGRVELDEQTVSIRELLIGCRRLVAERAAEAGLHLREELPPWLPDIKADPRFLKQILINLLSNAIKFTPAGGCILVGASHTPRQGITFSVCDTGIGIAPADQESVFKPFAQANNNEIYCKGRGLGLGLALVKRLAEAHDAAVKLDSSPGKGTDVRVTFPEWRTVTAAQEIPGPACRRNAASPVTDDVDCPSE